jgi:hypothetical protein
MRRIVVYAADRRAHLFVRQGEQPPNTLLQTFRQMQPPGCAHVRQKIPQMSIRHDVSLPARYADRIPIRQTNYNIVQMLRNSSYMKRAPSKSSGWESDALRC